MKHKWLRVHSSLFTKCIKYLPNQQLAAEKIAQTCHLNDSEMNGNWFALCILSKYVRAVGAPPSVAQNTFIFTLFKECWCMCLSNYISVHPECIILFSPVLCSCLVVIGQPRNIGSCMNGAFDSHVIQAVADSRLCVSALPGTTAGWRTPVQCQSPSFSWYWHTCHHEHGCK